MATYFNFNFITPAAPNDPLVDEAAHLNANWTEIDNKLAPYNNGTTVTPVEIGQEYIDASGRFAVWDGTSSRVPDDIDAAWSAWTNIPMLAPRVIRPGFQPKWRSNSLLRKVELTGGIQFDSSANTWTAGSSFQFNALSTGSPASSFAPIGGTHRSQAAAALTAGTVVVAAGYITVDTSGAFVRMSAQYLGGPGGGNFIMLDQVWWWY
jgi:hypothetical protein